MCRVAARFGDIGAMNSRRLLSVDALAMKHDSLPLEVTAPAKKSSKTPSCVVPNCGRRLRSKYEQRCRLCMTHLKAPQVAMPEGISRWCQKCGKFQLLGEFDDERRSCRVSLLRHMEKQRLARSSRSGHGTATPADSLAAPHVSPFATAAAQTGAFSDDASSESLGSPTAVAATVTAGFDTTTVTTATVSTDPANGNGNGTDHDEHANIRSHFLSVVMEQAGWADTSFNAHDVCDLPPVLLLPDF